MEGIAVGIKGMPGIGGNVGFGNVGMLAGKVGRGVLGSGGNVVVGMAGIVALGSDGIVGRGMLGSGGSVVVGTSGLVGKVGRDGIVGMAGRVGIGGNAALGSDGMAGNPGAEVCIRWRAAQLAWRFESEMVMIKERTRWKLIVAIDGELLLCFDYKKISFDIDFGFLSHFYRGQIHEVFSALLSYKYGEMLIRLPSIDI